MRQVWLVLLPGLALASATWAAALEWNIPQGTRFQAGAPAAVRLATDATDAESAVELSVGPQSGSAMSLRGLGASKATTGFSVLPPGIEGLHLNADTQLESDQSLSMFGFSAETAGDINGDGYSDVIVGAPEYDAGQTDEGAAFIFLGSASGIVDASPVTAHARIESNQAEANLGLSVASAGDVNGDGYDDVIVGATSYENGEFREGAAFVFLGSAAGILDATPDTAHARLESNQIGAQMGFSVAGLGDVNGDGYDDIGVGAYFYDGGEMDEGAVFVYHGSSSGIASGDPTTADAMIESDQASTFLGISTAGAGDVNADGYADIIIGAWLYDAGQGNGGGAFVFLGSETGIVGSNPATAHARITSSQPLGFFGRSVAGAGDVNGDGFDDVMASAFFFAAGEEEEGAAFVYLGGPTRVADGSPSTAHVQIESNQAGARLGHIIDGMGDFDGDGFDDIAVGAHDYLTESGDGGVVFVFRGGANGILSANPATAYARLEPGQADTRLGIYAAGAGDVNGDGRADVIAGADFFDAGQVDEGVALIYLPEPRPGPALAASALLVCWLAIWASETRGARRRLGLRSESGIRRYRVDCV